MHARGRVRAYVCMRVAHSSVWYATDYKVIIVVIGIFIIEINADRPISK